MIVQTVPLPPFSPEAAIARQSRTRCTDTRLARRALRLRRKRIPASGRRRRGRLKAGRGPLTLRDGHPLQMEADRTVNGEFALKFL